MRAALPTTCSSKMYIELLKIQPYSFAGYPLNCWNSEPRSLDKCSLARKERKSVRLIDISITDVITYVSTTNDYNFTRSNYSREVQKLGRILSSTQVDARWQRWEKLLIFMIVGTGKKRHNLFLKPTLIMPFSNPTYESNLLCFVTESVCQPTFPIQSTSFWRTYTTLLLR